ncbi:hypothetical protein [Streptomyces sp. NPDC088554]|uniref:hypothetical protein n=1 Tax=Streptomyces sp. NPDC088554 TaxID=3365865 RepID=UPI003824F0BF
MAWSIFLVRRSAVVMRVEEAGAVPGAVDEESVGVGFLDAELVGAVVPDGFVSEVADGDVEVLGLGGVVGLVYRVVVAEWFG